MQPKGLVEFQTIYQNTTKLIIFQNRLRVSLKLRFITLFGLKFLIDCTSEHFSNKVTAWEFSISMLNTVNNNKPQFIFFQFCFLRKKFLIFICCQKKLKTFLFYIRNEPTYFFQQCYTTRNSRVLFYSLMIKV